MLPIHRNGRKLIFCFMSLGVIQQILDLDQLVAELTERLAD